MQDKKREIPTEFAGLRTSCVYIRKYFFACNELKLCILIECGLNSGEISNKETIKRPCEVNAIPISIDSGLCGKIALLFA